jgi:hypothetical protein
MSLGWLVATCAGRSKARTCWRITSGQRRREGRDARRLIDRLEATCGLHPFSTALLTPSRAGTRTTDPHGRRFISGP